jgi:hypothetical protein
MSLTNPSSTGGPLSATTTSSIRPAAPASVTQNLNLKRSAQAASDGKLFHFPFISFSSMRP